MISSVGNPSIRRVRRLRKPVERERRGMVLVEGLRSVDCALEAEAVVELYLTSGGLRRHTDLVARAADAGLRAIEVTPEVMAAMTTLHTPPGVFAVARMPGGANGRTETTAVVLSDVRDPAAAGGIMAVAASMGIAEVVATKGSVDLFDPRTVRAGLGAHFRLGVVRRAGEEETIERFRSRGARIVAATAAAGIPPWEADLTGPLAVVVCGTDDDGPDADVRVSVPGDRSSVGARAAMVLYERKRQTS